jgi:hypothetical protein
MSVSLTALFAVPFAGGPDDAESGVPNAPQSQSRFTVDGSDALERKLAQICENVRSGVQSLVRGNKLEALVLGGGYGRGQGGVLKTSSGDEPYNDLEFYVFLRGNRLWNSRKYGKAFHRLGENLSALAGLHVEFKLDSLARLRCSPVTMFSYDLVSGHKEILAQKKHRTSNIEHRTSNGGRAEPFGVQCPPVFAGCQHHLEAKDIPLREATRLLFNRSTGLLLVKELLRKESLTPDENDFVGRNLAKAQLAFGDVVLTAFGRYHWSCVERRDRLEQPGPMDELPWLAECRQHHRRGVEFKLHPRRFVKSLDEFRLEHREISAFARQLWLWLESRRLNESFASVDDYVASRKNKCPDTSAFRNLLLNAKTFGPASVFDRMSRCYPRERLLNSLPRLLWEETSDDPNTNWTLQKQLRSAAPDWQSLVAAYKTVWPAFS